MPRPARRGAAAEVERGLGARAAPSARPVALRPGGQPLLSLPAALLPPPRPRPSRAPAQRPPHRRGGRCRGAGAAPGGGAGPEAAALPGGRPPAPQALPGRGRPLPGPGGAARRPARAPRGGCGSPGRAAGAAAERGGRPAAGLRRDCLQAVTPAICRGCRLCPGGRGAPQARWGHKSRSKRVRDVLQGPRSGGEDFICLRVSVISWHVSAASLYDSRGTRKLLRAALLLQE